MIDLKNMELINIEINFQYFQADYLFELFEIKKSSLKYFNLLDEYTVNKVIQWL